MNIQIFPCVIQERFELHKRIVVASGEGSHRQQHSFLQDLPKARRHDLDRTWNYSLGPGRSKICLLAYKNLNAGCLILVCDVAMLVGVMNVKW